MCNSEKEDATQLVRDGVIRLSSSSEGLRVQHIVPPNVCDAPPKVRRAKDLVPRGSN